MTVQKQVFFAIEKLRFALIILAYFLLNFAFRICEYEKKNMLQFYTLYLKFAAIIFIHSAEDLTYDYTLLGINEAFKNLAKNENTVVS